MNCSVKTETVPESRITAVVWQMGGRRNHVDAYESINNVLVHLFNDILALEEKAVITEEFKDLTNNDMHIIEAVGPGEGNNMSTIGS